MDIFRFIPSISLGLQNRVFVSRWLYFSKSADKHVVGKRKNWVSERVGGRGYGGGGRPLEHSVAVALGRSR